jgi:alpha-ribazole phosphatase
MPIHLIRHTTPNISKGICYGQSDIDVAPSFEQEWLQLKSKLNFPIDQLISSPLMRCTKLADKISNHYNIPYTTDTRILELNFGIWELLPWDRIPADALNEWMNNYDVVRCPRGESYADLKQRVDLFLNTLFQNQNYVIVTHAGVIKYIHDRIHSTKNFDYHIGYGGLYHLEFIKI